MTILLRVHKARDSIPIFTGDGNPSENAANKEETNGRTTTNGSPKPPSPRIGHKVWATLLLAILVLKLAAENYAEYGSRNTFAWFSSGIVQYCSDSAPMHLTLMTWCGITVYVCFRIEKLLASGTVSERAGRSMHVANLSVLLAMPVLGTHISDRYTLLGMATTTYQYVAAALKLWSYAQVNKWSRLSPDELVKKDDDKVPEECLYPRNLTVQNLYLFMFMPTLCYEPNYPRTKSWRWTKMLGWALQIGACYAVIVFVFHQFVVPTAKKCLLNYYNMDLVELVPNFLALAIGNHLLWLVYVYSQFYAWLNLLGEFLYFADREYYIDWWNAGNLDKFWRNWNLPVHRWALRHLYLPMMGGGFSKKCCKYTVFIVSGFLHEYLASVPLKTYRWYSFAAMMAQIPAGDVSHMVEDKFGSSWGNVIVWGSLIVGQPIAIILYFHDYVMVHHGEAALLDVVKI